MRKILLASAVIGLVALPSIALASQNEDKVNLCHKTGSDSHPFVVQQVNANEVKSHEANGDFVFSGPLDKNGHPDPQAGPLWCENHQPGDFCVNIDGLQTKVPDGDVVNADHVCTAAPPPVVTPLVVAPPVVTAPVTPPVFNGTGK